MLAHFFLKIDIFTYLSYCKDIHLFSINPHIFKMSFNLQNGILIACFLGLQLNYLSTYSINHRSAAVLVDYKLYCNLVDLLLFFASPPSFICVPIFDTLKQTQSWSPSPPMSTE